MTGTHVVEECSELEQLRPRGAEEEWRGFRRTSKVGGGNEDVDVLEIFFSLLLLTLLLLLLLLLLFLLLLLLPLLLLLLLLLLSLKATPYD